MRMEEQVLAIQPRRDREHPDEHPIKAATSTMVEVLTNKGIASYILS